MKKKSIFSGKMPIEGEQAGKKILDEVESLTSQMDITGHALIKQEDFENKDFQKNDITYLVKAGYELPEAKSPEEMLTETKKPQAEKKEQKAENSPYKMINLIAENFSLPEIDEENFLK